MYIRKIHGHSMLPAFRPGQVVVITRGVRALAPGDVVVVAHNGRELIKRVALCNHDELFVLGDNAAASTDSREFGWVSRRLVRGKVIWPRTQRQMRRKIAH